MAVDPTFISVRRRRARALRGEPGRLTMSLTATVLAIAVLCGCGRSSAGGPGETLPEGTGATKRGNVSSGQAGATVPAGNGAGTAYGGAGGVSGATVAGAGGGPMASQLPLPPGIGGVMGGAPSGLGGRRGGGAGGSPAVAPPRGEGGRDQTANGGRLGSSPGQGGQGGASASTPTDSCVYPSVTDDLSLWQQDDTRRTLEEDIARVATGIAGDWRGFVSTPWIPLYEVRMSFDSDGHYGGSCSSSSPSCCRAMYYGTDDDTPLKRYTLDSVTTTGAVNGSIDIIYGGSSVPYYESGYQGTLRNVQLDLTGNRLRFDFWYGGTYGPLQYDLERVTTP